MKSERFLLKPNEAAQALSISPRKLWSLTAARDITAIRIGRAVRYEPAELQEFIERHREGDAEEGGPLPIMEALDRELRNPRR